MELGVRTAVSVAAAAHADASRAGVPERAMTEHILALADRAGYRAALIDAAGAASTAVTTWPQFADTVRAAARGLSRRGLLDTDTVGVLVADAASHAVAIHAIRAAGAIAVPIHPAAGLPAAGLPAAGPGTADIAAQLKGCRARLLITSAALAELAIQAAERSWVRQVYAFGDAEGTTPFSDLLETAKHGHRGGVNGHVSPNGHDGYNGRAEGRPALRLTSRDVVVAARPAAGTVPTPRCSTWR